MSNNDNEKLLQILDAARKRFAHFGLAKTTMAEIASDIGMSKASLYYYFPDKEHLFIGVIEREMNAFLDQVQSSIEEPGSASAKLYKYMEERLANFRELLNLVKLESANQESVKPSTALWEQLHKREVKLVEKILELGVRKKEFTIENIPLTADMYVSVTRGLRLMVIKMSGSYHLNEEAYNTLKTHQEHFTKVFVKGISRTQQII